jgi:hypothetical protein
VPIKVEDDPFLPLPISFHTVSNLVPSSPPTSLFSRYSSFSVPLSVFSKKRKACYKLCNNVSNTSTKDKIKEQMDSSLPPSQASIKNNEIISIVEKGEDLSEFKFHYVKNRTKHLKDKKQHVVDKWHYKCN